MFNILKNIPFEIYIVITTLSFILSIATLAYASVQGTLGKKPKLSVVSIGVCTWFAFFVCMAINLGAVIAGNKAPIAKEMVPLIVLSMIAVIVSFRAFIKATSVDKIKVYSVCLSFFFIIFMGALGVGSNMTIHECPNCSDKTYEQFCYNCGYKLVVNNEKIAE